MSFKGVKTVHTVNRINKLVIKVGRVEPHLTIAWPRLGVLTWSRRRRIIPESSMPWDRNDGPGTHPSQQDSRATLRHAPAARLRRSGPALLFKPSQDGRAQTRTYWLLLREQLRQKDYVPIATECQKNSKLTQILFSAVFSHSPCNERNYISFDNYSMQ